MITFPGLDRISGLTDPLIDRPFRASIDLHEDNLLVATGRGYAAPPLHLPRLTYGSGGAAPGDIVWPRAVMQPFVSDRIITLLREHGVTGWDSFPVEIIDKRGDTHQNFHRLMITGRCGRIDWTKGEHFERTEVPLGWHYRGGWFDPDTWDGSDMFTDGYCGETWVVDRARRVFQRAKIRNIRWNRLVEIEMAERHAISRALMDPPLH
jgi:hypothetical protein